MKNTTSYLNILLSVAILLLCIKLVSLTAPERATAATVATTDSAAIVARTVDTTADTHTTVDTSVTTQPAIQPVAAQTAQPAKAIQSAKAVAKKAVEEPVEQKETKAPEVQVINTTDLGKDIMGYAGPTPVEITIEDGKVKSIKALPNQESPGFLRRVLQSGLLEKWNGKTVEEARELEVDAVTGATFTSTALIKNVKKALGL